MNSKNIVTGIIIFGAGLGLGYFICNKRLSKRYQEDVAEVKEFYMEKIKEIGVMGEDFTPEYLDDEEDNEDEEDDEEDDLDEEEVRAYYDRVMKYSSTVQPHNSKGKPIIKYNKPPLQVSDWGDLEEDLMDEEDPMDEEYEAEIEARAEEFAKRKNENRSNGLPYVIDFDEYEETIEGYERQTLYYYALDRVLCEDNDEEVEDEEVLVGFDYEDVLDMQTTAWVRNDQIMVIYEIIRVDDSYAETVANAIETPSERERRISNRRRHITE